MEEGEAPITSNRGDEDVVDAEEEVQAAIRFSRDSRFSSPHSLRILGKLWKFSMGYQRLCHSFRLGHNIFIS